MTDDRSQSAPAGWAAPIKRFDMPPTQPSLHPLRYSSDRAVVRVTHASVGVTDVMAARGDYLLHPRPGFISGYDLVGEIESLPAGSSGLRVGQRVAAILPGMGAHTTRVTLSPSLLVPVPEALDSASVATAPLDAVTAHFALAALPPGSTSVLIQGIGGALGAWAAQLAQARGLRVWGTASSRSQAFAEGLGAHILDYRDPDWMNTLNIQSGGGVDGVIDATGNRDLHRVVAPRGRIVRLAFGGPIGRQKSATARGFVRTGLHRFADPSERVCSAPMIVALRRDAYRRVLADILAGLDTGSLLAPEPVIYPLDRVAEAFPAAGSAVPGTKVVLDLG
ncbi:quinone oxidoreductase family protein [Mycetocola lacteus]|nr:zinc-binding dehydrogenase [Mycetocola lacteus]